MPTSTSTRTTLSVNRDWLITPQEANEAFLLSLLWTMATVSAKGNAYEEESGRTVFYPAPVQYFPIRANKLRPGLPLYEHRSDYCIQYLGIVAKVEFDCSSIVIYFIENGTKLVKKDYESYVLSCCDPFAEQFQAYE